jgi:hypothetical protein
VVVTVGGVASNGVNFAVTVPAPSIASLNPTSGLVGTSVTIAGANFGATQGTNTVTFNGIAATLTSWSTTSIVVSVPTGATTGNAIVTTGGVASNGVGFTLTSSAPIVLVQHTNKDAAGITSATLAFNSNNTAGNWIGVCIRAGHSGQVFTVTDSKGNAYNRAVQFNVSVDAPNGDTLGIYYAENIAGGANVITVSDTISGTLRFAILEYSGVATANSLDVIATAQGTSASPNSGNVPTTLNGDLLLGAILTGNSANYTAGIGNAIRESVPTEPNTKLMVEDQSQAIVGSVSASASLGAADSWGVGMAAFKSASGGVATKPSITRLNPASGVVGASVTITGTNFGAAQGTSTMKFNGITATPTSWSATSIVAAVPAGATTGNVVVTVGGVASNGVSFAVIADPTPPVVTITAPANNATVSGTITLTATATDPDSAVSFVQFKVDGANVGAQLTTAPYSLSLNTATLSNATHSLTAVAQDPSGNVGTSGAVTITVSNATAGLPTLIYSTAVPLAIPSGSSWNGPGSCTTSAHCYRIPVDPNVVTAGSTMVMAFGYNSAGANQVFAVTDDKSDTWVLDATSPASNNKTLRMYRAANVTAGVSYIQVQLTGGTDNRYWQAQVAVFYNVGALDVSSCNAGSSATIQAGSLAPTVSGDLIYQAKFSANTLSGSSPYGLPLQAASFTPGLQPNITWSLASQLLGDGAADQYGVYNSTVAMNPTFTQAASDSYVSCAMALRAASAGAAPTAIPRVVHQEHDAMPKNAANPWHVGVVVDVPNSAVYLSYVGNDSISSVSSSPAPNVGWTASGVDFNGLNGHNHVNFYCAQWTTPPGAVNLSINRSATPNDSINMIYVVQNGTCNLDVDSGGQAGQHTSPVSVLTTCSGCITPTKKNDFIMANGGQGYCTATSLSAPSGPGGVFDSVWFTGNTVDGPTQTDENNFWMHFYNGNSLSPITVAFGESCNNPQDYWAGRVAAYQSN